MSVQSMTGFASRTILINNQQGDKAHATITVKTLNSRFFDITCRIHPSLAYIEYKVINLCKQKLYRGNVVCTIYISNSNVLKGEIQPSLSVTQQYISAANKIKKEFNISSEISLDTIINLPSVVIVEESKVDQNIITTIQKNIDELLDAVVQTRIEEGKSLKKDLNERITIMRREHKIIEARSKKIVKEQKEKIKKAITTANLNPELVAETHNYALSAILEKLDLHEEIVRFASHLDEFARQLKSDDTRKGKRLDFILQELGREINTIASKCNDSIISKHSINVKVEIEKAREQTQNIV
jgi:uncharacterized protein (TIGR00255 family)